MIYFDNTFSKISWDEEIKCVIWTTKGLYYENEDFRLIANKVLELFKEKKEPRFISDIRTCAVVHMDDQAWSAKVWFPQMIGAGMLYFGIVMPQTALARMVLTSVTANARTATPGSSLLSKHFANLEEAREWIANPTLP